ncbi:hypothetical protein PIB30_084583, partial [Stylosanthes scabra]|nr:hypothetical protein [Stylosanthes scabra]
MPKPKLPKHAPCHVYAWPSQVLNVTHTNQGASSRPNVTFLLNVTLNNSPTVTSPFTTNVTSPFTTNVTCHMFPNVTIAFTFLKPQT